MGLYFLILRHHDWEGPGIFFVRAAERIHLQFSIVNIRKEPIPPLSPYDGLIVLGSQQRQEAQGQNTFLEKEISIIRDSIADDRPYLGFNLGHQLLAEALGAKSGPNFMPSFGFSTGYLTCSGREHAAFVNFPRAFPLLKWHHISVMEPLPKNISLLATSKVCQVEAISAALRPHILGLQFDSHLAHSTDIKRLVQHYKQWQPAAFGTNFDHGSILNQSKEQEKLHAAQFYQFLKNYIRLLR